MQPRHGSTKTLLAVAAGASLMLAASLATAADEPAKRKEGRYFVELAEIMLSSDQFDVDVATIDPDGVRNGGEPYEEIAKLSAWSAEAPAVTIGLNRPSGKTTFSATTLDFDRRAAFIPQNFDDESKTVFSHFIPPGIVFQRQGVPPGTIRLDDDYVPNMGTERVFLRSIDFKSLDLTLEHNIVENKRFRLRWLAGLKYAQFEHTFAHAVAFAKEISATDPREEHQDFFFLNSKVETHGLGPKLGLASRWLLDEKKKWSIDARFDVAAIPEKTTALYEVRMVDSSGEEVIIILPNFDFRFQVPEGPVIPGLGEPNAIPPFANSVQQEDFTKLTWLATGRMGFRYRPKSFVTLGLDLWQMRWHGLLSQAGMIDTVHRSGRYEVLRGDPSNPDPQLQDTATLVRVPRFSQREDFVFDGVSLNLTFDF